VGAARRLGRRYRLKGVVGRGDQRGRELGFPTANLTQPTSLLPGAALYSAIVTLPNGERRRAAVNLGGNPTFGVDSVKIEAHLLEFSGDLYGAPLTIDFCEKIRDIVAFDSPDALLRQMRSDLEIARRAPWD
ncbi:MAG: riboflavin kinase, partial [Thermoguttaceae bacterium]|nr:riboflavin kinase [Thermoguttaceae bacterium]